MSESKIRKKVKSAEYLELLREKEAEDFKHSRAGIQMSHDDPNMYSEILREIEHPFVKRYTTGNNL